MHPGWWREKPGPEITAGERTLPMSTFDYFAGFVPASRQICHALEKLTFAEKDNFKIGENRECHQADATAFFV